jgi:serine/threonine-protein kinase 24/25/MST4
VVLKYRDKFTCVVNTYTIYREESKQDSDLDEPWIMTVKGPHSIKPPSDEPANHKIPQKVQNGSGPPQPKSPPKDSNLNHYRSEKATPVSSTICVEEA